MIRNISGVQHMICNIIKKRHVIRNKPTKVTRDWYFPLKFNQLCIFGQNPYLKGTSHGMMCITLCTQWYSLDIGAYHW